MNKPIKLDALVPMLADIGVSISELKKNPGAVVAAAREQQVAILNRNRPVAYVISPAVWEYLCDLVDDAKDAGLARERLANPDWEAEEVSLDDL